MSLHLQESYTNPQNTARVARVIFSASNLVMRIADKLHRIVGDRDIAGLFPMHDQSGLNPSRPSELEKQGLVGMQPFASRCRKRVAY